MHSRDNIISRFLFLIIAGIILYWLGSGVVWVWNWYFTSGGYTHEWWPRLGSYLLRNISIVLVIYGLACMQASGLAELKFRKNFIVALMLALVLTPPVMMLIYGKRQQP